MNKLSNPRVSPSAALLCFLFSLVLSPAAWAYKVERVCEEIAATDKKPAHKVCKTLLVRPKPADGKEEKKEEKKKEKKAGGH